MNKNSPLGYDAMIDYLAQIENTPSQKTVYFKTIEDSRKSVKSYEVIVEVFGTLFEQPIIEIRKGGIKVITVYPYFENNTQVNTTSAIINHFATRQKIDLPIDTKFSKIFAKVRKGLNDFKTVPEYCGKQKIDEGGGWYSWGSLYKINDKYFEY